MYEVRLAPEDWATEFLCKSSQVIIHFFSFSDSLSLIHHFYRFLLILIRKRCDSESVCNWNQSAYGTLCLRQHLGSRLSWHVAYSEVLHSG